MYAYRLTKLIIYFLIGLFFLTSCGGGSTEKKSIPSKNTMADHPGALTYKKFCASCHQSDGSGVPGMYPPISETKMVNGETSELIGIILNGMSGEIEVKGEIYNNVMPSHKHLTDQQVADLLTYVKNSFGNEGGSVSPEEVSEVRKKTN